MLVKKEIWVAPLVGAWIEIMTYWEEVYDLLVAPLVGAWIEIIKNMVECTIQLSRSSRGSVD